ncbi:transposase [Pseudooceanicola marinus]
MRTSRFSKERINGIPKEHQAGIGSKELCRQNGTRDGTFCKWR